MKQKRHRKNKIITGILAVCILAACTPIRLEPDKLREFVRDPENGLYHEWKQGKLEIDCMYQPSSLAAYPELKHQADRQAKDSILSRYHNNLYFLISYSYDGNELLARMTNTPEFSRMVNYFSFGLADNIQLITDTRDTLRMVNFHSPRLYGMAKSTTSLLVFDNPEDKDIKEMKLEFREPVSGSGIIKFPFRTKDIKKVPDLKL